MTTSSIIWFSVDKGDVAKAILAGGQSLSTMSEFAFRSESPIGNRDIAIGYTMGAADLLVPAVAVVDKHRVEDLFAWLATYSPDVFPISQYVRVLDVEEWTRSSAISDSTRVDAGPIWSSLILGEMLAQGNAPDMKLTQVPLSRVPFCLSYTQARASAIYGGQRDVLLTAAHRLVALEKADKQWRALKTDTLRAAWALVEDAFPTDAFTRELVAVLAWTFERNRETRGAMPQLPAELRQISLDLRKVASGPLEYRVEEFERATTTLASLGAANDAANSRLPALFAALALWVGSGTSHISLLSEFGSAMPATFVWFGTLAGVLGQNCWHSEWARTVAGIAKVMRANFDVATTSAADLSWTEFEWLVSVGNFDLLAGVPRASAKLLAVDVLPGAPAPFRTLSDDVQANGGDTLKSDRFAGRSALSQVSGTGVRSAGSASSKPTIVDAAVKFSPAQFNELSSVADALYRLLNQVAVTSPPSDSEPFELKPPQSTGAKKTSSSGRKSSRKTTSRK